MVKKQKRILAIAIIIVVLIVVLVPWKKIFLNHQNSDPAKFDGRKEGKELPINALVLYPDSLTDFFRTKGVLMPDKDVSLSFEASGKITQIDFKEGSFVTAGTLIAKVNDELLVAELKKLEAQLPLALDRVLRQKTLYEKDAVSKETYETVNTELETLKAEIDLVNARIRQTELRAPFDGVLGIRAVNLGAYVTPSTIITQITKISPLKIEFYVNEKQADLVKEGTPIDFTVENETAKYHANVYVVESKLDYQTLSLRVRALYPNLDGKIKPGHSAAIEIITQQIANAIVIPDIATIAEMGKNYVFVYHNGKAKRQEVVKGIRTAASVQILEGLTSGDTLITTGVMQLRDGMAVKLEKCL
ncbi:MAG: efflux RND transporter periplasmic adaptor subunit [Bacteroidales bacterium]|jgi:membrane fusion protein (multidrug efflux system)|nr:efflux RND transporter periplasmic adaptor subunit [Bacteroidales bacterium]